MVQYSRSHTKRVNSSFTIETFHEKKVEKKKDMFQMADVLNLGVYLAVPLLAGIGIGIVLDTKFGTRPICILSGLLLGVIGSFFNLIKIVRQFSKNA